MMIATSIAVKLGDFSEFKTSVATFIFFLYRSLMIWNRSGFDFCVLRSYLACLCNYCIADDEH